MRAVIVGAGMMGRFHAEAIRRAGARVVAVVDEKAEARAGLARATGGRPCASLEEALALGADAIHVCTPLGTHASVSAAALEAGCHVLVEKPATSTADEARALVARARTAGRLLVPVHQFAFQDGVRRILARQSALGVIRHLEFATCSAGADHVPALDRDLVAAEIVPHGFGLAHRLLGVETASLDWTVLRPAPGEWRLQAATGAGAGIAIFISLAARPTFAHLRILGDRGSAHADLFHGFAVIEPGSASRGYKIARPLVLSGAMVTRAAGNLAGRAFRQEGAYPGLRRLVREFYRAVRSEAESPIPVEELVDVARSRDAVLGEVLRIRDGLDAARRRPG